MNSLIRFFPSTSLHIISLLFSYIFILNHLYLNQQVFKGIFIHRYRDVRTELREESMSALGRWVAVYPDKFLNDEYLKYFGWTLNDKAAVVRLTVCQRKVLLFFSYVSSFYSYIVFDTRY